MKTASLMRALVLGLTLLSCGGCATFKPPADDRAVWEEDQKQQRRKESPLGFVGEILAGFFGGAH
jgi:hypothetical protein